MEIKTKSFDSNEVARVQAKAKRGRIFRTTIDIEENDYRIFKALCASDGVSVVDKIRAYIKEAIK